MEGPSTANSPRELESPSYKKRRAKAFTNLAESESPRDPEKSTQFISLAKMPPFIIDPATTTPNEKIPKASTDEITETNQKIPSSSPSKEKIRNSRKSFKK